MFFLLYPLFHFYSASVYFGFEGKTFRPIRNIWYEDILPFTDKENTSDSSMRQLFYYLLLQPIKFILHILQAIILLTACVLEVPLGLALGALCLAAFLIFSLPLLFFMCGSCLFYYDPYIFINLSAILAVGIMGSPLIAIADAFLGFTHALLLLLRACTTFIMYPFMGIYLLTKALWPEDKQIKNDTPIEKSRLEHLPPELLQEIANYLDKKSFMAFSLTSQTIHKHVAPLIGKDMGFVVVKKPFFHLNAVCTPETFLHLAYHYSTIEPALALFTDKKDENPLVDSSYLIESSDYTVLFQSETDAVDYAKEHWDSSYIILKATSLKNKPIHQFKVFWDTNQKWDSPAYIDSPFAIGDIAQKFNKKHSPQNPNITAQVVPLAHLSFFSARSAEQSSYQWIDSDQMLKRMC